MISLSVTDVAFCDPDLLIVTGDEGSVTCFKSRDLTRVWAVSGVEMVNCVAAWGRRVVTGTDAGHLEVRNTDTGHVEASLVGHDRGCGISGLAVSHLGLWSSCFDCKLRLWSEAGDCLCVLVGHTNPVRWVIITIIIILQLGLGIVSIFSRQVPPSGQGEGGERGLQRLRHDLGYGGYCRGNETV